MRSPSRGPRPPVESGNRETSTHVLVEGATPRRQRVQLPKRAEVVLSVDLDPNKSHPLGRLGTAQRESERVETLARLLAGLVTRAKAKVARTTKD